MAIVIKSVGENFYALFDEVNIKKCSMVAVNLYQGVVKLAVRRVVWHGTRR